MTPLSQSTLHKTHIQPQANVHLAASGWFLYSALKPSLSLSPLILRPWLHLQLVDALDPAVLPLRLRGSKVRVQVPRAVLDPRFKSELSFGTLGVNFRL